MKGDWHSHVPASMAGSIHVRAAATLNPSSLITAAAAIAMGLAVAGCSSGGSSKSSQVVATVNGGEITVTQLNRLLQTNGVQEVTPEVKKRALEALTSEELMVQAAVEHKIDRDPAFVQAMEQSRRQLLAQFFAERNVYPKAEITPEEITEYYRAQPLLFANRKKFRLTTFIVNKTELPPPIESEFDHVESVDQVRRILESHAIEYTTQLASIAPEQLPIEQLPVFAKTKVGDLFVNERGDKVQLVSVTGIDEDVPLTLDRAKPIIQEYLRNSRNKKATEEYLKQAKAVAKITPADGYRDAVQPPDANVSTASRSETSAHDEAIKKGALGLN
jgi:peptidyl-prolyl cis-trans isomerase C